MANPFDVSEEYYGHLINLVTRVTLPDDDADKLIAVQKAGEEMFSEFVEEQLIKYTQDSSQQFTNQSFKHVNHSQR